MNYRGENMPGEIFRVYRCLQLLTIQFNLCFGRIMIPIVQIVLILLNIIPVFMIVRLHDHLPWNEFVKLPLRAGTTILINSYMFPMLADIQRLSTKFVSRVSPGILDKFGQPIICISGRKWHRRILLSCRPLRYSSSAMFFMKKYYTLRVFGFVIFYTAKLLLVF